MNECPSFESCNAGLCPLDSDLNLRVWYADEDICKGRAGSGKRWIKKQRSIVRRQTKCWLDKPISFQELHDASRPRVLTNTQRKNLTERMAGLRAMAKQKAM